MGCRKVAGLLSLRPFAAWVPTPGFGCFSLLIGSPPMAHSLSANKRIRQNIKLNALNRWRKTVMKDETKECMEKIVHGTEVEALEAFKKVSRLIDRTAQKGTIHKNQAARRKSRLAARIKAKFATK